MIFFTGCHDPNKTGSQVLPDEDIINGVFTDTFTISLNSFRLDTVNTMNLSQVMFGDYIDPEFGHISAAAHMQFTVEGSGTSLFDSTTAILDSVVLELGISGAYGRTSDKLTMEIFEINDSTFDVDSNFNSSTVLQHTGVELSGNYVLDMGSGALKNLRIPLDSAFGEKLLNAGKDTLNAASSFNDFFNGLLIRVQPVSLTSREPGAIYYVDVSSPNTSIHLYYKDGGVDRDHKFQMDVGSVLGETGNSARFTQILRTDYSTKLFGIHVDDTNQNEYEFMQAGALTKMHFKLPFLDSLYPIGINKAELILYVDQEFLGSAGRYQPSSQIFVFESDATGKDELDLTAPIALVSYNSLNGTYTIPLSTYTAEVLAGIRENNGIIIQPASNGVTMNRCVIGGTANAALAPKFRVIYTTFPE